MKCPKCDREINDDNIYCPYCGARVVKNDEQVLKEIKNLRRVAFIHVFNRILNISTFAAVIFMIIGLFGPILIDDSLSSNGIGGLSWFAFDGWRLLNNGVISIGPFITTFVLYVLVFIAVVTLSSFAIYKAINSLRKREECRTIPHIIFLAIIHRVYSAFIYNFYYESISTMEGSYATGSGWGEVTYSVTIPLFIIALIVLLIAKAIFSGDKRKIVSHIFIIVSSFLLMNTIGSTFAVLGYQNIDIGEAYVFGTLHYFEVTNAVTPLLVTLILMMFGLGVLYIGAVIALVITSIRNLVKKDEINRSLYLGLSISLFTITLLMLIVSTIFGFACNEIDGYYNAITFLSTDLLGMFLASNIALGFSIAVMAMGKKEPEKDNNIVDVEVEDIDQE